MDKREMKRRPRREFTADFKSEAVRLCKVGDRTVRQVANDLDLTETALREWVKRADIEVGAGPPGALTSDERAELVRLRAENKRLQMEREVLKNCLHGLPRPRWIETISCYTELHPDRGRPLFGGI